MKCEQTYVTLWRCDFHIRYDIRFFLYHEKSYSLTSIGVETAIWYDNLLIFLNNIWNVKISICLFKIFFFLCHKNSDSLASLIVQITLRNYNLLISYGFLKCERFYETYCMSSCPMHLYDVKPVQTSGAIRCTTKWHHYCLFDDTILLNAEHFCLTQT